jgi:hypothetical protein
MKKEAADLNLRRYYTFGMNLLTLMLLVGGLGLVATAVYEWMH